jgi:putative ABC transport system permease protein
MLARRNLLHDRVRFAVTLTGIVFAVVLSSIQLGLFVGFRRATSDLMRFSGADIWVRSAGVTHLETPVAFPDAKRFEVLAVPGVADAQSHIVNFGQWKKPNGADEGILVIGLERRPLMGPPASPC